MNVTVLASAIVSRIRASMQDSALNQEVVVAGMIREALDVERVAMMREVQIRATNLTRPHTAYPQTLPAPDYPPKGPEIYC